MYAEIGDLSTPTDTQVQEQDLRPIFCYYEASSTKVCAWWILDIDKYANHHKNCIEIEKQIGEFLVPLGSYQIFPKVNQPE